MDGRVNGAPHLVGGEATAWSRQLPDYRTHERGRTSGLVQQRMCGLVQNDLVSRSAVHRERDLVAHRAAREEEARFLSEQLRHHLLQSVDGRVFALLLVAHLRGDHGLSHRGRRAGDGVAVEVDEGR